MDKFCFCDRFQFLLRSIELSSVTRLINRVILTVIFMHIYFLIELTKHHIVFLVVKFPYVKFQASILFTCRENLDQSLALFICDLNLVPMHQRQKVVHKYDTLIVWVRTFLDLLYELFPIGFQVLENFFVNANTVILLHLEMQLAEVVLAKDCLPTLSMLAIFLSIFFVWTNRGLTSTRCRRWGSSLETVIGIVLPKIEAFSWVYFTAHSHLEIFIGNLAVTIQIEFVEKLLKLFLSDSA